MIDWTQPCETDEDPPRPVRVLFDKDGAVCALEIYGELYKLVGSRACRPGLDSIPLRNVATKPVRHEGWIAINPITDTRLRVVPYVYTSKAKAQECAPRAEAYIHAVWSDDGSPVEDDSFAAQHLRKCIEDRDHWKVRCAELEAERVLHLEAEAERDAWKAKVEALQDEVNELSRAGLIVELKADVKRLEAEVEHREKMELNAWRQRDTMRPVVGAAVAWDRSIIQTTCDSEQRLLEAVRAYQNAEPATSESHEAMVDDALDGLNETLPPVKKCETCPNEDVFAYNQPCAFCRAESQWEPKP